MNPLLMEFMLGQYPPDRPMPVGPMYFPQMGPALSAQPESDVGHADVIDAVPGQGITLPFSEDTAGFRQQRLIRGKPVGLGRGWRE